MNRPITGFHADEEGDWVAELACGHDQHVRHDPPLVERPWVLADATRSERIGMPLECPLCDRLEIPAKARPFLQTERFRGASTPSQLDASHGWDDGVWGRVRVLAGEVSLRVATTPEQSFVLVPGTDGLLPPGVPHEISAAENAELYVLFLRVERSPAAMAGGTGDPRDA